MSLLMEALRKAEQEKKAAANRLEEAQGQTSVEEEAQEQSNSLSAFDPGDTGYEEITLDVMADWNVERSSEMLNDSERQSQAAERESTGETLHDVVPGADDRGLIQEQQQGEVYTAEQDHDPYQETLPGVSAVQFAKDVGSENASTPVAAQTVFAATGTMDKTSSGYKWLFISAAILVVVVVGAGYYYSITPMRRGLPAPQIVKGMEGTLPAQIQTQTPGQTSADAPAGFQADNETLPEALAAETTSAKETPASSGELPKDSEDLMAIVDNETVAELNEEIEKISEAEFHEDLQDAGAQGPETSSALFKISRSKPGGEKSTYLNEAFLAYQAGKFEIAKQMYTEILTEFPGNRDALLGMGAIALNAGEKRKAAMFYAEILRLNPQDSIAKTMLMNLQSEPDQLNSISKIKSMLYESPEQPALHFTLGNIYARQSRWAEAQQEFFTAWHLDASNPDYVFNLAISLEQIGQHETALDYYNVALKLADERTVNFDPAVVINRISVLNLRN